MRARSTYREQALKLYPWICGRCTREFDRANVQQLTVHHKDHNHDNNPPDGSNWELLCVYCHDNEHSRELEAAARRGSADDGHVAKRDTPAFCRSGEIAQGRRQSLACRAATAAGAPVWRQPCGDRTARDPLR